MNSKIIYLSAVVAIIAGSAALRAEDKKPEGHPSREEMREKFKNATPEEREKMKQQMREKFGGGPGGPGGQGAAGGDPEKRREEMKKMAKDLGLDPEELQKLPPEERMAKYREAAEKKYAELNKKKEAGTLTADEKELLQKMDERRERMKKFREEHEKNKGDKPAEKPADKK